MPTLAELLTRKETHAMTCPHPRCDALLHEDRQFRAEMAAYNLPQRRFACDMGHSHTVGIPEALPLAPRMGAPVRLPNQRGPERVCAQCGELFSGIKRQKFCSSVCTREADAARNRKYPKTDAQRGRVMVGEELRQVRAIPRPWNSWKRNGTPPQPYATRPAKLDQKWV